MTYTPQDYERFKAFLEDSSGIVLGENKQYLVQSRLGRLMQQEGLASLGEVVNKLTSPGSAAFRARVIDAMTTNETLWFRDGYPFRALTDQILPEFAKNKKQPLRIWSAACSSGQEPYSIAMILADFQRANPAVNLNYRILASDLSENILEAAREARYDDFSLSRGLGAEQKARYFHQVGEYWELDEAIKNRIDFRVQNLLESFALLGRFDVIYCRNVLIYFSQKRKEDIIRRLADVLEPGGYLILGASETLHALNDRFEMVRLAAGGLIYRKLPV